MTEVARAPGFGEPLAAAPASTESFQLRLDLSPLAAWSGPGPARRAGPARVVDLVLAVVEATANTVRHAGGSGNLRIWQDETEFVCEVSDAGRWRTPARAAATAGRHPRRSRPVDHPPGLRPPGAAFLRRRTVVRMHMRRDAWPGCPDSFEPRHAVRDRAPNVRPSIYMKLNFNDGSSSGWASPAPRAAHACCGSAAGRAGPRPGRRGPASRRSVEDGQQVVPAERELVPGQLPGQLAAQLDGLVLGERGARSAWNSSPGSSTGSGSRHSSVRPSSGRRGPVPRSLAPVRRRAAVRAWCFRVPSRLPSAGSGPFAALPVQPRPAPTGPVTRL